MSVALMAFAYLLLAYSTVTGFSNNGTALANASVPFISVAHGVGPALGFFAYLSILTSTLGVLIAAVNSQCRLVFNAGREGLLPRWIGHVHPARRTPVNAIIAFVAIAGTIIGVWVIGHLIGGTKTSGSMNPLNFFDESGTMGTLLVLVVYFLANLALPFYYRRYRPAEFNVIKHGVLPVLGLFAIGVPVYYLCKPPQSAPYSWFPWVALGIAVASVVYAMVLVRRDPGIAERVGSIVADE
jgi:amino acid transporter